MRLPYLLLLALGSTTKDVIAFPSSYFDQSRKGHPVVAPRSTLVSSRSSFVTPRKYFSNKDSDDCGCAPTIFSGKPSDVVRSSNPRQAIRNGSMFGIDSEEVRMDDLLENKNDGNSVSIVVFLRSLG